MLLLSNSDFKMFFNKNPNGREEPCVFPGYIKVCPSLLSITKQGVLNSRIQSRKFPLEISLPIFFSEVGKGKKKTQSICSQKMIEHFSIPTKEEPNCYSPQLRLVLTPPTPTIIISVSQLRIH